MTAMGDKWEFTRQEAAELIDRVLVDYDHPQIKGMPEDLHFEQLRDIYGSIDPSSDPAHQFRNQGALIAVLFWKLAEARGYVGSRVA